MHVCILNHHVSLRSCFSSRFLSKMENDKFALTMVYRLTQLLDNEMAGRLFVTK